MICKEVDKYGRCIEKENGEIIRYRVLSHHTQVGLAFSEQKAREIAYEHIKKTYRHLCKYDKYSDDEIFHSFMKIDRVYEREFYFPWDWEYICSLRKGK